ncbi:MAG TPA: helix-turn-helix transcriptional regulator [Chitinophagaceae bacterium]|nr:helix-turn-helix transcriptional regulator [Chitinophagaceae bacterium]
MKLHQKIAAERRNKGITQEELATMTGLTVRTIQRIESGENVPRSYTLRAIAKALNKPMDIFTATDNSDSLHALKLINLSCFSYLLIPWIHFLVPMLLQKVNTEMDDEMRAFGKKIVRQQVYWVIAANLLMLLTVVYNVSQARLKTQLFMDYMVPFFLMYGLNAVLILRNASKIKRRFAAETLFTTS